MYSFIYLCVVVLLGECYAATWFSNAIDTLDEGPVRLKSENRIVGGVESLIEKYPFQVSLVINSSTLCGGSIISQDFIMTAAHCVVNTTPDVIVVRAGSDSWHEGGITLPLQRVVVHPSYNTPPFDNDIAVLRLQNSMEFTSTRRSIPLPAQDLIIPDNTLVTITGWGLIQGGGTIIPDRLMAVTVPVINRVVCKLLYFFSLTEHMFCAGHFMTGGKGSCQGDSGGPVTINGTVVVGVVSFGRGCAQPLSPGVYANVASLRDWIQQETGL